MLLVISINPGNTVFLLVEFRRIPCIHIINHHIQTFVVSLKTTIELNLFKAICRDFHLWRYSETKLKLQLPGFLEETR